MSIRPPQTRADSFRRLFLVLGAAVLPMLGGVLGPAHGDTGDAGADDGTACFPWDEAEEGDCPSEEIAAKRFSDRYDGCVTEVTGWGEYDDDTCCYPVAVACTYAPLGFGCSSAPVGRF